MRKKATSGKVIRIGSIPYDAAAERERNSVGARLAELRRQTGMSLIEFGQFLKINGLNVGRGGLNKWENGVTVPNAYQLLALCAALGVNERLEYFTDSYRALLNEEGLRKVEEYREDLIASGKYKPEIKPRNVIRYIEKPVSCLAASAGTGNFLDEECFEMIPFPESSVPERAEFGIRVAGDSMEPVYHDGQIVWVQPCDTLDIGEVGIFICNGEGFLKVYSEQDPDDDIAEAYTDSYGVVHPQPVLISYNQAYEPRVISPNTSFRIVGRVL